ILQNHPDWEVVGIDSRDTGRVQPIKGLKLSTMKYSRGNFEKLFRESSFDIVYHLARFSHSSSSGQENLTKRLELSVMGTNRILDIGLRFNVKKIIVLSTYHVYGALSDNSIFLPEDSPLKASLQYPELLDVVEMDQIATNFMWKYQKKIDVVVLRPCNIIGNQIKNTMSRYLMNPLALRPIDYNPMFQFIHEFDMATVLMRSANEVPSGIYNVATDEFIALRKALKVVGVKGIPFSMALAGPLNHVLKRVNIKIPDYLIDYLKYSCLINNTEIKKHLGENFYRFSIEESLKLLRA
ncbi:MAG: NAD-dependent epimerase/dehydratase family protein, partial [Bacteriovoracaceae bacterium]|nr:NAD-dependent epimerase/dehydratase family protein [Bacteriovoracaceae bacterium]